MREIGRLLFRGSSFCVPFSLPLRCVIAGIPAELIMILGYLFYTWVFLGYGAASVGEVLGNTAQAAAGIAISALLTPLVSRPKEIQETLEKFQATK